MASLRSIVVAALGLAGAVNAIKPIRTLQDLRKLESNVERWDSYGKRVHARQDTPDDLLSKLYPEQVINVPVDHFHNDSRYEPHSNETFGLRFWFDSRHYRKGGPVIVLQGGETNGADRLPFLQKGILAILAEATGGMGVVLEHRYYGRSYVTPNFTTESLRFLSTDQALADMAYFAKHVVFPGFEDWDLTAPDTPYIAYGGSYAGAMVAFLRKLYPEVYTGAIASSAVTKAIYDYWEYFEAARLFSPPGCAEVTQKFTSVVDNILLGKQGSGDVGMLKTVFGLVNLTNDKDFAMVLSDGISRLQDLNWDPAESSPGFYEYCGNVTSDELLYPDLKALEPDVKHLISVGGHGYESAAFTTQMLNYIGHTNSTVIKACKNQQLDVVSCFGSANSEFYHRDSLTSGSWRPWPYQFCTEWGYLATGSGVPKDQLPLISRLIDIEYSSIVCREAFNISSPPNLEIINKHGGFNLSYPRLAFIDGDSDPWRAATPHRLGLPERENTVSEPFLLIKGGVHHWDENGVFANETKPGFPPETIVEVQKAEADFVKSWLTEWAAERKASGTRR